MSLTKIAVRPSHLIAALLVIASVGSSGPVHGQSIPPHNKLRGDQTGLQPRGNVQQVDWTRPSAGVGSNSDRREPTFQGLPHPVRHADHVESELEYPMESELGPSMLDRQEHSGHPSGPAATTVGSAWEIDSHVGLGDPGLATTPRHPVLRPPATPLPAGTEHSHHHHGSAGTGSNSKWVHPPYSSHRRRIQPAPPMLPGGRERPMWKSPYSYGYFGASGTRHWSLHHGYRDRYTEWRLK